MNPAFRPRRPILRRTRSRSSSSSSDSVKVASPPNLPGPSRPPLRRRPLSKSRSPVGRRRAGSRPRTRSRSPQHGRPDRLPRGNDGLQNITIGIRRSLTGDNATLRRDVVVNPSNVVVVRRPGEGSRPLFDREEIKVHTTDERRIVSKSSSPSKADRTDRKRRKADSSRDRERRERSRSRSRSRSRIAGRHLIDQRYVHKLRKTRSRSPRNRRRSRSRSGERRRDRDRRGRSREREEQFPMVPMIPVPMRPRMPFFGPVMPYARNFIRPFPVRFPPGMRMMYPRPFPAIRIPSFQPN